jgi:hypothetical protein
VLLDASRDRETLEREIREVVLIRLRAAMPAPISPPAPA